MKTPELDKILKIKNESEAIGEFVEWLNSQGIILAEEYKGVVAQSWVLVTRPINELLARYFDIDTDKAEAERRQILASLRAEKPAEPKVRR